MEALVFAIPLLALAPSLLPTLRSILMAAGCLYVLLMTGFLLLLRHFGATAEEGPAFAGAVILFGLTAVVLFASCTARFIIGLILTTSRQATALLLRRILIVSGLAIAGSVVIAVLEFSLHRGFAILVGSISLWLVMIAWLIPRNSFDPTPLRGPA